jgi:hypothetical protein
MRYEVLAISLRRQRDCEPSGRLSCTLLPPCSLRLVIAFTFVTLWFTNKLMHERWQRQRSLPIFAGLPQLPLPSRSHRIFTQSRNIARNSWMRSLSAAPRVPGGEGVRERGLQPTCSARRRRHCASTAPSNARRAASATAGSTAAQTGDESHSLGVCDLLMLNRTQPGEQQQSSA